MKMPRLFRKAVVSSPYSQTSSTGKVSKTERSVSAQTPSGCLFGKVVGHFFRQGLGFGHADRHRDASPLQNAAPHALAVSSALPVSKSKKASSHGVVLELGRKFGQAAHDTL